MASKFDTMEAEDRRVWRELYDYTSGGGTTSGHKPSSSPVSTPSGPTGPYDDPDIGKVAYDKYGRLIKPRKQNVEGGSKKPLLSRNTKATLWRRAGQLAGMAIGGGPLGALVGNLLDPRERAKAARYGTSQVNSAPSPKAVDHNDFRLDEPDWSKKDMEKPFSKRLLDRAEELQVGKSRGDFSDEAKRARDDSRISKWIAPPDEDHEPEPTAP